VGVKPRKGPIIITVEFVQYRAHAVVNSEMLIAGRVTVAETDKS